jgi:hypothetical protein
MAKVIVVWRKSRGGSMCHVCPAGCIVTRPGDFWWATRNEPPASQTKNDQTKGRTRERTDRWDWEEEEEEEEEQGGKGQETVIRPAGVNQSEYKLKVCDGARKVMVCTYCTTRSHQTHLKSGNFRKRKVGLSVCLSVCTYVCMYVLTYIA